MNDNICLDAWVERHFEEVQLRSVERFTRPISPEEVRTYSECHFSEIPEELYAGADWSCPETQVIYQVIKAYGKDISEEELVQKTMLHAGCPKDLTPFTMERIRETVDRYLTWEDVMKEHPETYQEAMDARALMEKYI